MRSSILGAHRKSARFAAQSRVMHLSLPLYCKRASDQQTPAFAITPMAFEFESKASVVMS